MGKLEVVDHSQKAWLGIEPGSCGNARDRGTLGVVLPGGMTVEGRAAPTSKRLGASFSDLRARLVS